jgi:hypothetical protein
LSIAAVQIAAVSRQQRQPQVAVEARVGDIWEKKALTSILETSSITATECVEGPWCGFLLPDKHSVLKNRPPHAEKMQKETGKIRLNLKENSGLS